MIKIFAIDDHKMLIDSFTEHFKMVDDIEIVDYALSGQDAIAQLHPDQRGFEPDVVLLDIGLGDMSGIDCAKSLLKQDPTLRIIGLSTYKQSSIVKKLLKVGAKAYLSKATDIAQLEEAIREVHRGEKFLGEEVQKSLVQDVLSHQKKNRTEFIPKITPREKEILVLIAEELSTKEISEKLFISINTVETHRKNLISKFGVKNSIGLVRTAMELKLLD